jgi:hypothetical protein
MNNEWERLWKETVMGKFSEFSWQLLDWLKKTVR